MSANAKWVSTNGKVYSGGWQRCLLMLNELAPMEGIVWVSIAPTNQCPPPKSRGRLLHDLPNPGPRNGGSHWGSLLFRQRPGVCAEHGRICWNCPRPSTGNWFCPSFYSKHLLAVIDILLIVMTQSMAKTNIISVTYYHTATWWHNIVTQLLLPLWSWQFRARWAHWGWGA